MPILSVRLPQDLIDFLDKVRGAKSRSEIIRSAAEGYKDTPSTLDDIVSLLKEPKNTMNRILDKHNNELLLTAAEIEFLAIRIHECYRDCPLPLVPASSINEIMWLFLKLRMAVCPDEKIESDNYYMGNLGTRAENIEFAVRNAMVTEKLFTPKTLCEFKSRNLEVITRDIKNLNIDHLNKLIADQIDLMLALARRSFWYDEEEKPQLINYQTKLPNNYQKEKRIKFKDNNMSYLFTKNYNFMGEKYDLSAALYIGQKGFWITLNNYLEIEEFLILANAILNGDNQGAGLEGKIFTFQPHTKSQVILTIKNLRMHIDKEMLNGIVSHYIQLDKWEGYCFAREKYGAI